MRRAWLLALAGWPLLAGCGISDGDRVACDGGRQTRLLMEQAATAHTDGLREEADEIGRRAWDAARGAAGLSGDEELRALADYWGPYSSPLIESDVAQLLDWCHAHGWEPDTDG